MKILNKYGKLALLLVVVLGSGCASIDKAPPAADAAAKKFMPNKSASQVYLFRDEMFGAAISMPVTVNGKFAGNTGPNSYFKFDLPAGKHTFASQGDKSLLDLTTKNGETYYIWQEVKMGAFSAGSKLQLVDEARGQKGVLECSLINSQL